MRWFDRLGGHKFTALLLGIIIPQYGVLIGAYWIAFKKGAEMGFNFATFFCGITLAGILVYCGANVVEKFRKNGKCNGGGK